MSIVIVKVKVMPDSPEANLADIKKTAQHSLEKEGAKSIHIEEQNIAFGLRAVIISFAFPESKGTDIIESLLSNIAHVSSVTIEDYRRAFG